MIKEQLILHAARIAGAKTLAASARRLASYEQAMQVGQDGDPLCPDCWMHQGEELAMAPISSETPGEHQFGCMECGFEASFPARAIRYRARQEQLRKRSRAA